MPLLLYIASIALSAFAVSAGLLLFAALFGAVALLVLLKDDLKPLTEKALDLISVNVFRTDP